MKYQLKCKECGSVTPDFATWFKQEQACPKCGSKHSEAEYFTDYAKLRDVFQKKPDNFWAYFDFLPLTNRENIITCNEGTPDLERWSFLENFAKKQYGLDCKVFVCRNDLNGGTQTFKDVAAALGASIFQENGVREYCVASTGNTATAFAKYLALAGIKFTNFAPSDINPDSVEEIRALGQQVVLSTGNYAQAKKEAADFASQHHVLISTGNIDPIRVEAKKTMAFDFMRQLGQLPDVYMQAVGGGTGPIALDKGVRELQSHFSDVKTPRMLLVQQDLCDPMVQGWETARAKGFPDGFENEYPTIANPQTKVSILSAGVPTMFPVVAPIVRKTQGDFLRVKEAELPAFAKKVFDEMGIYLGPASIVCIAGFYQALAQNKINEGETVLLNIGEGAGRASAFVEKTREADPCALSCLSEERAL